MTAAPTVEALGTAHPEWHPWLGVFAEARRRCGQKYWRDFVPDRPREFSPEGATDGGAETPWLAGADITVDGRTAADLVGSLARAAAEGAEIAATLATAEIAGNVAVEILEASINEDFARLGDLADTAEADRAAFASVGALVAMPLLHACREAWQRKLPQHWPAGYCPLCGAWPTLAEACGLERARMLRCGRCGTAWRTEWLRCPYCGLGDHERLGALVPDVTGDSRKVETCAACRGYVKTLAVLRPTEPLDVRLRDLETIDLDVAALEHGFTRPAGPGFALGATVTTRPRSATVTGRPRGLVATLFGRRG